MGVPGLRSRRLFDGAGAIHHQELWEGGGGTVAVRVVILTTSVQRADAFRDGSTRS